MLTTPQTSTTRAPLIEVKGLRHLYHKGSTPDLVVLDGVEMTLCSGEIVGLLGRSGSGKSTLLRSIAGLLKPSAGSITFGGNPVVGCSEGVSMVFQSFALFPWLTVLENVEIGLEARGVPAAERRKSALAAIDLIGLDGFENAYPKELSGGMRQRVGLARALVVHPQVLLMDEPFSALDVLTAETLRTDLIDLWSEGRMPIKSILMVTHNIEEAVLMCDRVLVFSSNPGRIAAEIKIELPRPRSRMEPAFRELVDRVYGIMTKQTAGKPAREGAFPGTGLGMALKHVSSNTLAGLMETVDAKPYDGKADLPHIAQSLQMEIDDLFPAAETLQLLRFAELAEGDLRLTSAGRRFAHGEVDERKRLFAEHLVSYVPIAGHIRRVLDERPSHHAPATRFKEELEDYMSPEFADETLHAVISWGRYGEVYAYDEQTDAFSLENPA